VSGIRAPALIAFVKDTLIYLMIVVAIICLPTRLGGWSHIFGAASAHLASTNPETGQPFGSFITMPSGEWAYATLALGSALALFMYPLAITGVLAVKRRDVIRRNMAALPAHSLMPGLVALLGHMALASPRATSNVSPSGGSAQLAVPSASRH
jgi:solute:Na+ symporter, SSS family